MKRLYSGAIMMVFMALCVVVMSVSSAQSPDNNPPLYIIYNWDLYSFDLDTSTLDLLIDAGDELNQTNLGAVESPTLSPDGNYIAYRTPAPITIDAIQRVGGIGGGQLPDELMLYDVSTGQITPLAIQADDATFVAEDGTPDHFVAHSSPVWSDDGTRLVWTELYDGDQNRLMMMDMATRETQVIVDPLPIGVGIPTAVSVRWGEEGIYYPHWDFNTVTMYLYSEDGTLRSNNISGEYVGQSFLTIYEGKEYLAYSETPTSVTLLDPLTGDAQMVEGLVERYSVTAPNGNSVLNVPTEDDSIYRAYLLDATGNPLTYVTVRGQHRALLNPDATMFIYRGYDLLNEARDAYLSLWLDGRNIALPIPDDAFIAEYIWGRSAFRINTDYTDPAQVPFVSLVDDAPFDCPNTITPRLTIGGQAIVLPGDPNNVRDLASTSGSVVGMIPAGEPFIVNDGPACGDGIVWWHVTFDNFIGWTAEGVGDTYFLEPIP